MAAPKKWPLSRKGIKFIARPKPGSHKLEVGMPLGVVLREIFRIAPNMREIKYALRTKDIKIDGRKVIEPSRIIGFMDILEIPGAGSFRVIIDCKGFLKFASVPEKEAGFKICKITGKNTLPKNETAIHLHDGKTIIAKSDFKAGDSVVYHLENKKTDRLELKEGASIILTGGRHIGYIGNIVKIEPTKTSDDKVVVKTKDSEFVTLKKYVFVIGKDKPMITT